MHLVKLKLMVKDWLTDSDSQKETKRAYIPIAARRLKIPVQDGFFALL